MEWRDSDANVWLKEKMFNKHKFPKFAKDSSSMKNCLNFNIFRCTGTGQL